jgi:hypothetical protein
MNDPHTPEEWQDAVDSAYFLSLLDSARHYGLIETALDIDADRCEAILRAGKAQGYEPNQWRFLATPREEDHP